MPFPSADCAEEEWPTPREDHDTSLSSIFIYRTPKTWEKKRRKKKKKKKKKKILWERRRIF
ncbi:hypothetical protein BofuT4_uP121020.1 [Botrytis cinerea T4]|uniref:Uncharacterized protein n=1 Tax=Botryotinia fuckeliana (strain T4) TaxID=999810 RepID=G2YN85_BOTF4|nr:hypothetical protein BofuT4_uP121020.1 [Botrytis cinerea T4]